MVAGRSPGQGYAPAALKLGELHASGGAGVQRDMAAVHWFSVAAELGQAETTYRLGGLYHQGRAVLPDPPQAFAHDLAAASHGHEPAIMLDEGNGMPENSERALQLYLQAAQGGLVQACSNLAVNLHIGKGAAVDPVEWRR